MKETPGKLIKRHLSLQALPLSVWPPAWTPTEQEHFHTCPLRCGKHHPRLAVQGRAQGHGVFRGGWGDLGFTAPKFCSHPSLPTNRPLSVPLLRVQLWLGTCLLHPLLATHCWRNASSSVSSPERTPPAGEPLGLVLVLSPQSWVPSGPD